jgi:HEXXH motif-containing protein
MIEDDPAYRGFSCPQVGLDKPFAGLLVVEHARQTIQTFIERYASQLERRGSGLVPVLTSWLSHDETFETTWDLAFGQVFAALLSKEPDDLEQYAGAVALRLHECGYGGEWELQLPNPVHFRFDRWLLPVCDSIQVSTASRAVSIRTQIANARHSTAFQHSQNGWVGTTAHALPVLVHRGIRCTVLTAESLPPAAARLLQTELYKYSNVDVDAQAEMLKRTWDAAVGLITEFAGIYLPWISYVLRNLIPLPAKPGMLNSGSDQLCPGVICISNQDHRCNLAEMLVHETTHQYLYILNRLGPLDDGTDQTLYFSPFRNTGRPIFFIVLAYHAFGNVLLFYRTAQAHGLSADEPGLHIDQRLQQLEQQLETLEQALQTTTALTPLGRALWEPLYEEIHR